jgi:hypothetical protein
MRSIISFISMRFFLFVYFISLVTTLSFGSFIKAQEEGKEEAPPTPASTPAAKAPSVIATTDGDYPDIKVEITELKRTSGNTLTLKFTIINDSSNDMGFKDDFGEQGKYETIDYKSVGGVNLVDAAGKKKYLVLRDSDGKCLCSRDLKDVQPDSRVNLYAKFPAPPDDVENITVEIPHFIPMDDVPISK